MKKASKSKVKEYDLYDYSTYKYHGVFISNKNVKKIDPKRFMKIHEHEVTEDMYQFMSKRNTKYYFPPKQKREEYLINIIKDQLAILRKYWNTEYKELIDSIDTPQKRYQNCVEDTIQTPMMVEHERETHCRELFLERETEHSILVNSFLAQNVLYIASMLEVILQEALSKRDIYRDKFNRRELYLIYRKRANEKCREMKNFKKHDKFMALYKFIKHSSEKNFIYLKENYSDLVLEEVIYKDEVAASYLITLDVNGNTLNILIDNLIEFFEEYIEKAFHESSWEAKWNYGDFFKDIATSSFNYGGFFE